MKKLFGLAIIALLMMVVAPAWSAQAVAVYHCSQEANASEDDVDSAVAAWLKGAKQMKGGEGIGVVIMYPLAAAMGETDFLFLVTAPSIAAWGEFMDNYEGNSLAAEDKKFADVAACADSALWEWVKFE